MRESLTVGLSEAASVRVLQLHRLWVFYKTFDDYLAGKATAEQVKERANKMLEIGLPERLK